MPKYCDSIIDRKTKKLDENGEICGKSCRDTGDLTRHKLTHLSDEEKKAIWKFECDSKIDRQTKKLDQNGKICGEKFRDNNGLDHHKLTHLPDEEKKAIWRFECDSKIDRKTKKLDQNGKICGEKFEDNKGLTRHKLTHLSDEEKKAVSKFECDSIIDRKTKKLDENGEICGEKRRDTNDLTRHKLTHLPEEEKKAIWKFECDAIVDSETGQICGEKFRDVDLVEKHKKHMHSVALGKVYSAAFEKFASGDKPTIEQAEKVYNRIFNYYSDEKLQGSRNSIGYEIFKPMTSQATTLTEHAERQEYIGKGASNYRTNQHDSNNETNVGLLKLYDECRIKKSQPIMFISEENLHPEQALIYERAKILALGLKNLCNEKNGHNTPAQFRDLTDDEISLLGTILISKSKAKFERTPVEMRRLIDLDKPQNARAKAIIESRTKPNAVSKFDEVYEILSVQLKDDPIIDKINALFPEVRQKLLDCIEKSKVPLAQKRKKEETEDVASAEEIRSKKPKLMDDEQQEQPSDDVTFEPKKLDINSLNEKSKLPEILEAVTNSTEFDDFPISQEEEATLKELSKSVPNQTKSQMWSDPHVKVNLLLNAYLSRRPLPAELNKDVEEIVLNATRLVQTCVDVLSSKGWLSVSLRAMKLSQMFTQAMQSGDHQLKQLPHFSVEPLKRCRKGNVKTVLDLIGLEDDVRSKILEMEEGQLQDVTRFCNNYPSIDVKHEIETEELVVGKAIELAVSLTRKNNINGLAPPVVASFYPHQQKEEGFWLVVGEPGTDQVLAIKHLVGDQSNKAQLEFIVNKKGKRNLKLYLISDSYIGSDQEFNIKLNIRAEDLHR